MILLRKMNDEMEAARTAAIDELAVVQVKLVALQQQMQDREEQVEGEPNRRPVCLSLMASVLASSRISAQSAEQRPGGAQRRGSRSEEGVHCVAAKG